MVCELPVLDPPAACLQFEMEKKKIKREQINDVWIAIYKAAWESTLTTSPEKKND